jgi:recombination protein RecA
MYQTIAQCQRVGGIAILDDAERAFDRRWARILGINLDELIYYIAPSLEEGFEHLERVTKSVRENPLFATTPILYIKDSLAASIAKAELGQEFGKSEMGLRARSISQGLRRLTNLIADQKMVVIFVNQLRANIGVLFGEKEETTGGKAPKFYAGLRAAMTKGAKIVNKERTKVLAVKGLFEVVKSKVGIPFKRVGFELLLGKGIPALSGLLDYLVNEGVIARPSTGWFEFKTERFRRTAFEEIWRGKQNEMLEVLRQFDAGEAQPPAVTEEGIEEDK